MLWRVHLKGTPARPGAEHVCRMGGGDRGGRGHSLTKGTWTSGVLTVAEGTCAPTMSTHMALSAAMVAPASGECVGSHLHHSEMQENGGGLKDTTDKGWLSNKANGSRQLPCPSLRTRRAAPTETLSRDQLSL